MSRENQHSLPALLRGGDVLGCHGMCKFREIIAMIKREHRTVQQRVKEDIIEGNTFMNYIDRISEEVKLFTEFPAEMLWDRLWKGKRDSGSVTQHPQNGQVGGEGAVGQQPLFYSIHSSSAYYLPIAT